MLSDEEPGFAGGLDRGLLDCGHGCVEVFDGGCGDGDEAGVAEDAVSGGEVGFLLEHVVVFGGLGGVFDLADLCALGLVGDVLDFLLADVAGSGIGVQISENDRWMPVDSNTGDRNPGYTSDLGHSLTQSTAW